MTRSKEVAKSLIVAGSVALVVGLMLFADLVDGSERQVSGNVLWTLSIGGFALSLVGATIWRVRSSPRAGRAMSLKYLTLGAITFAMAILIGHTVVVLIIVGVPAFLVGLVTLFLPGEQQ